MDTPYPNPLSEIFALCMILFSSREKGKNVTNLACRPPEKSTLLPRRGLSGIVSPDELPIYHEFLLENRISTGQGASICYSTDQPPMPGYLDQQWLSQRAVLHSKPTPVTGLLT